MPPTGADDIRCRVRVDDQGGPSTLTLRSPDEQDEAGRGLAIVAMLSASWSVDGDEAARSISTCGTAGLRDGDGHDNAGRCTAVRNSVGSRLCHDERADSGIGPLPLQRHVLAGAVVDLELYWIATRPGGPRPVRSVPPAFCSPIATGRVITGGANTRR